MCVCVYACSVCVCVSMCVFVCVHSHTHTHIRDVTIHNLDVSIYCHLCITIQRYIARYNQV